MSDVRSHLDQLAGRGEHRGAAEVFRRARTELPEMRPETPRSPRWRLVSAAVAVLVVAAGAVVVLRAGESGDRVQVTGPRPDLAAGWTPRVKASAGIGDWTVRSVAATKSGFVAIGDRPTESSAPVGMWTSPDGRHWTALTPDDLPAGAVHLAAVAAQPDGTSWIIGNDGSGPAVWRSNGRSWSRSASGSATLSQARVFVGLTATAGDLVAFGKTTDRWGTWSSRDGKAWRFSPLPGETLAVSGTADRLIALVDVPGVGSRSVVVFTSADHGTTWARGTVLGSTVNQVHEPLTCNDAGCWAITGPIADPGPTILWRSRDGLRWNKVDTTMTTEGTVDTLTVVDGYVVATGTDHNRPAGWVSVDGVRWTAMAPTAQVDPIGGGRLDVVGAASKVLVAFGSTPGLEYFFTWEVP